MDPNSFARPDVARVSSLHLDWTLDFDKKVISGTATLGVERVNKDASQIVLDSRDLSISSVTSADGDELTFDVGDKHAKFGSPVTVTLPTEGKQGESITVHYSTSPASTALQWLEPELTVDRTHPYVFSQCQAIHCRSLAPVQDTPGVKCPYTASVRCPQHLTALMSAVKKTETLTDDGHNIYTFEQTMPMPSYLVAIVAGRIEGRKLGERTRVWAEPSVLEKAAYEFAETEKLLSVAEEYCGPYQWKIYELVILPSSFPFGGMENPCLTFVTPTLLSGDRSAVDVVIHEITHSWTGNLVTSCKWSDFWLNEGFTMFIERKILGILHGQPTRHLSAIEGWKNLSDCITSAFPAGDPLTALVPDLTEVDPDDAFSTVPYEKGHTFLWFLEELLGGPETFDPFLRAYLTKFSRQSISTEQFLAFLREHFTDKKELLDTVDWQSWLYKPGMPDYTPTYNDELARVCDGMVATWVEWDQGQDFPATTQHIDTLSTKQIIEFLDRLYMLENALPIYKLEKMEEMYSMFQRNNFDIKMIWLRMCIKSRWDKAVQPALEFVTIQGRMKFTRPIYRELYRWEGNVRSRTVQHFHDTKHKMMHVAQQAIRHELALDELALGKQQLI